MRVTRSQHVHTVVSVKRQLKGHEKVTTNLSDVTNELNKVFLETSTVLGYAINFMRKYPKIKC